MIKRCYRVNNALSKIPDQFQASPAKTEIRSAKQGGERISCFC